MDRYFVSLFGQEQEVNQGAFEAVRVLGPTVDGVWFDMPNTWERTFEEDGSWFVRVNGLEAISGRVEKQQPKVNEARVLLENYARAHHDRQVKGPNGGECRGSCCHHLPAFDDCTNASCVHVRRVIASLEPA